MSKHFLVVLLVSLALMGCLSKQVDSVKPADYSRPYMIVHFQKNSVDHVGDPDYRITLNLEDPMEGVSYCDAKLGVVECLGSLEANVVLTDLRFSIRLVKVSFAAFRGLPYDHPDRVREREEPDLSFSTVCPALILVGLAQGRYSWENGFLKAGQWIKTTPTPTPAGCEFVVPKALVQDFVNPH